MDFLDISSLGAAYDMLSKSRKNLSRGISESLGLQIHHNKSMVKVALTHKTKDKQGYPTSRQPIQDARKEG
jgi:hypothetical protein